MKRKILWNNRMLTKNYGLHWKKLWTSLSKILWISPTKKKIMDFINKKLWTSLTKNYGLHGQKIRIKTVVYYKYTYAKAQYRREEADSVVVQVRTVYKLLTSVRRHEERDTIFTMLTILSDPHQRAVLLAMFKISVGRDPKNSTLLRNDRELNSLCPNGREINCLPAWSTFNCHVFKILQKSAPTLLDMTSSTLQPHFLSGGVLWQWWLL